MSADVRVSGGGSIVFVEPVSDAAIDWIDENVSLEPWQWQAGAIACEPRMALDLIGHMRDDGLDVCDGAEPESLCTCPNPHMHRPGCSVPNIRP